MTNLAEQIPDIKVSIKQTFGIDSEMFVSYYPYPGDKKYGYFKGTYNKVNTEKFANDYHNILTCGMLYDGVSTSKMKTNFVRLM